jgi:hypothetical protein
MQARKQRQAVNSSEATNPVEMRTQQESPTEMSPSEKHAAKVRVVNLLNSVGDLRSGDLEAVLRLDEVAPFEEEGAGFTEWAKTGEELAYIYEHRLRMILCVADGQIESTGKYTDHRELGDRRFTP